MSPAPDPQSNPDALRAVVDHAPIAIMTVGSNRVVTSWNRAAERIFGWTADEAIGKTPAQLMLPPDQFDEHESLWQRAVAGEALNGVELRRRRKDGSRVDLTIWTSPLRASDGKLEGLIAFCADVTDQTRLQEQLLHAQRMESIGRLAGGISHDFNNLLAVISGYSESMLRRTTPEHPLRQHAEEIQRAASRGAALTQQLLAFSRRQSAAPRVMDLALAVRGTYSMLRRVISDKIEIQVSADAPAPIKADAGQIEQALVNLAINARDAIPETGGKISISVDQVQLAAGQVQGLDPGRYARLSVCDSGFGMDAETCARIFEPFFSTKEGRGTGLGLSIVYGIATQAGGNVTVHSTPGEGSRFEVFFPCAP
jgi:two-component system cell cycle sensor histidine kinase/response regulator CckA